MSYQDGLSALNLEMPRRIPRTEYSVETHWKLISAVTGIAVDSNSSPEKREQARKLFVSPEYWNFDFFWHDIIDEKNLGSVRTDMGHAVYEEDGSDFTAEKYSYFSSPQEVIDFDPLQTLENWSRKELIHFFEEDYRQQTLKNPHGIHMTGIYITLISGCIALFGWDNFLLALGIDAAGVGKMLRRYKTWLSQYTLALAESSVPVVLIHDDMVWTEGPFVHPEWYRSYVFPLLKELLDPIREAGKKIIFTCDGNFNAFIDDIAACGVHGFVFEPFTDLELIARKYGKTHVLIGNADTRVLLHGDKESIYEEVKRCISIGKNCPGYFLSVGNHIPSNTPVENALRYEEYYKKLMLR